MFTPRTFKSIGDRMRFISDQCYEKVPVDCCIYCGDCWEVYDHVPPIAAYCTNSSWAFKYPSCKNCNALLRAIPFKDIRIRRYFILKSLYRKHSKLLRMPEWSRIELHSIKGWIRGYVKSSVKKKRHILKRIDFLTENYLSPREIAR